MITAHRLVRSALVLIVSAPCALAQPPERIRIDVGLSAIGATNSAHGFFGGAFPPASGETEPLRLVTLADVTATVNVTSRITASIGVPFAVTLQQAGYRTVSTRGARPQYEPTPTRVRAPLGDLHWEVGAVAIGERRYIPAVSVGIEMSQPTASAAFLGTGEVRIGHRAILSKTLHPRLSVFGGYGASQAQPQPGVSLRPARSIGTGMAIGMTRAAMLNLYVEQVIESPHALPDQVGSNARELRAGVSITRYSRGRPRVSLLISAASLRQSPVVIMGVRWAVVSR